MVRSFMARSYASQRCPSRTQCGADPRLLAAGQWSDVEGGDDPDPAGDDDGRVDVPIAPDQHVVEHRSEAALALGDPLARLLANGEAERQRSVAAGNKMLTGVG